MSSSTPSETSYDKSFDLTLWRRLFRFTAPYRREVILLGVAAVGTAAAEIALPLVTLRLIDSVGADPEGVDFTPYVAVYAALTAVLFVCVRSFIRLGGVIRTHTSHDIRSAGFQNLQRLSFSFYDQRPVGWLMARMTSDCERLSNILAWGVLDMIWGGTMMVGIAIAMLVLNAKLALIVMAVIPVLAVVSLFFQKRILKTARVVRKTNSRLTSAYNEAIMGVRTTKVFVRERENLGEFRGLSTEMYGCTTRNALLSAVYLPLVLTLASLAAGLALAVGGVDVLAAGLTIGTLVTFMTYTRHFYEPVQELSAWFAEMQMAQASAERILGLIDAVPEIQDSDEVSARIEEARHSVPRAGVAEDGLPDRVERIAFRGVTFGYGENPPVLEGLDLEVRRGETIALVGSTGGGKSTIASLLCRFYEPTAGAIELDGVDYRGRGLHWLQSKLGIVLQTPHLFSGSIADNIRYGRLEATDDEIEEAARLAGAHDFIAKVDDGYAAEVGEGGVRLSVGEKQLVSFARAILARPEILVMDEATSSIDTETEQRIQRGVTHVLEGRTSFVIAHRLSTIRSADRILVIERGRIAEQGTHAELLAQGGRYHRLYTEQSLREGTEARSAWTTAAATA